MLSNIRELMRSGANERVEWIRSNLAAAVERSGLDAASVASTAGVSPGTLRNFLTGTDSSLSNVIQIGLALGMSLADLERPPTEP